MERLEFLLVLIGFVLGRGCKAEDIMIEADQMLTDRNSPCMTNEEKEKIAEVMTPITDWMLLAAANRATRRFVDKKFH